jgi:dynein heavy chain 1
VQALAIAWLASLPLPGDVPQLVRTAELAKDPIFRCLDREVAQGATLLRAVRRDLDAALGVCAGTRKATADVRGVMGDVARGTIPAAWAQLAGPIPKGTALAAWVADMAERAQQWRRIASYPDAMGLGTLDIWLGGLFSPEAYITATRQAAAHASGTSLEELVLQVDLDAGTAAPGPAQGAFVVTGLALAGATVTHGNALALTEVWYRARLQGKGRRLQACWRGGDGRGALFTPPGPARPRLAQSGGPTHLARTLLRWGRAGDARDGTSLVTLPAYRHGNRQEVLFAVDLDGTGLDPATAALRSVALVCSSLS